MTIGAHEEHLARARSAQADPAWRADYTATRPKVERKIGRLMRRRHGGRRARVRGTTKVAADFSLSPPRSTWRVSACLDSVEPPAKDGRSRQRNRKTLLDSGFRTMTG